MNKKDVKFETMRGKGPGGQHRNKTDSCVRAIHLPTGLEVTIDGRKQGQNKKKALRELEHLLAERAEEAKAASKKAHRDAAIHDHTRIRTYNYDRGVVKDHRTGKTASLKQIMKGKLELLR